MVPYKHLCIDIETANAEPTEIEAWARRFWAPDARWKPETIGTRYLEALAKKKERLALLDSSPIIAIGIQTDRDLRCLHSMVFHQPRVVSAGLVEGFQTERDMLMALRNLIEGATDEETVLVGHNIKHFDLPKIRGRFIRNNLRLPFALVNKDQPVYDTMTEYSKFSLENDPFVSASDVAEMFGIPNHKRLVEGAGIPDLYAGKKYDEIIAYCMLDVMLECDLFTRMTGQAQDEAPQTVPFQQPTNETTPSTKPAPALAGNGVASIEF